jgi:aerobic C4-dicarboxylate transport protein
LWVQVLIAMAVGVVVGHFYPKAGQLMQPLGDGFIKLIRMLIAPIIFCTVVHGIAKMGDMSKVGKVAIKALIYFEVMTTVALAIAMVIVNLWQPGAGMHINTSALDAGSVKTYVDQSKSHGAVNFLLDIIPSAMVGAFAEGNVLQVLLVSVILGSTLVAIGPRGKRVIELLEIGSEMLFRAVAIVMWAAPIGLRRDRIRSAAMGRGPGFPGESCSPASTRRLPEFFISIWLRCRKRSASASSIDPYLREGC